MNHPKPIRSMDRRSFLKRGVQTGALVISYPIWKHLSGSDRQALLAAEAAPAAGLDKDTLRKLLEACLSRGGDFAEAYYERSITNSLSLDEDKITTATRGLDMGVGFRVIQGEKTGYAFSDDLDFARLKEAAETAALIASGAVKQKPATFTPLSPPSYYLVKVSPDTIASKEKVALLVKANAVARAHDLLGREVARVEHLIGYEGNAFASTGKAEEDLLAITAVHPMRKEAVDELLGKAGADWSVVRGMMDRDLLVWTEYEGRIYFVRKFPEGGRRR